MPALADPYGLAKVIDSGTTGIVNAYHARETRALDKKKHDLNVRKQYHTEDVYKNEQDLKDAAYAQRKAAIEASQVVSGNGAGAGTDSAIPINKQSAATTKAAEQQAAITANEVDKGAADAAKVDAETRSILEGDKEDSAGDAVNAGVSEKTGGTETAETAEGPTATTGTEQAIDEANKATTPDSKSAALANTSDRVNSDAEAGNIPPQVAESLTKSIVEQSVESFAEQVTKEGFEFSDKDKAALTANLDDPYKFNQYELTIAAYERAGIPTTNITKTLENKRKAITKSGAAAIMSVANNPNMSDEQALQTMKAGAQKLVGASPMGGVVIDVKSDEKGGFIAAVMHPGSDSPSYEPISPEWVERQVKTNQQFETWRHNKETERMDVVKEQRADETAYNTQTNAIIEQQKPALKLASELAKVMGSERDFANAVSQDPSKAAAMASAVTGVSQEQILKDLAAAASSGTDGSPKVDYRDTKWYRTLNDTSAADLSAFSATYHSALQFTGNDAAEALRVTQLSMRASSVTAHGAKGLENLRAQAAKKGRNDYAKAISEYQKGVSTGKNPKANAYIAFKGDNGNIHIHAVKQSFDAIPPHLRKAYGAPGQPVGKPKTTALLKEGNTPQLKPAVPEVDDDSVTQTTAKSSALPTDGASSKPKAAIAEKGSKASLDHISKTSRSYDDLSEAMDYVKTEQGKLKEYYENDRAGVAPQEHIHEASKVVNNIIKNMLDNEKIGAKYRLAKEKVAALKKFRADNPDMYTGRTNKSREFVDKLRELEFAVDDEYESAVKKIKNQARG